MQDLHQGTELANRYTLLRKLGGGATAQTWLATDRVTSTDVALKIPTGGRPTAAELRHEWQTSIRLMHAHIVRVFEFNDDPDCPFYSLQFIDGPDIGALAGAPPAHSIPPIALVADALRYAHCKDVVHRDIKASNILLDRNGAPYLIDFGVATAQADTHASGGSLIAASPQSLDGEAPQPADDIFALGGLLYELVSGRSPYSSDNTADDIRRKTPEPLEAADGTPAPERLQMLVGRMLDKDPRQRPDAEEVVSELAAAGFTGAPAPRQYLGEKAAAATAVIEASEAIRPRWKRAVASAQIDDEPAVTGLNPKLVVASLVLLLAILGGVVFFLPGNVPTEPAAPLAGDADTTAEPEPRADSGRRGVGFTENVDNLEGRDERVVARAETEAVLGELLSKLDTLDKRAVQRWGGLRYRQAQEVYAEGDEAYLARDYATAIDKYRQAIAMVDPLLDEVDAVFATTLEEAQAALEAADPVEALRLFELAVAISPDNGVAKAGFERAKNLEAVLSLTDQGLAHENDLELEAARQSFAQAVELDPQWEPAREGLVRVEETIRQMEFDQRMTEGLEALANAEYAAARAAFRMAQQLKPESREPADGLLQVDQGVRLDRIAALEEQAAAQERNEKWSAAVETYEEILEIDANLAFAQDGLARSQDMQDLHRQIEEFIAEPDRLSSPVTMRAATKLVVDITRMPEIGPRLADQRDELSRLLKRAATPLTVQLVSDNQTDVSIYKVGRLGSFATQEVQLRPGTYVAVGSRPGYRDVRLEFRVGPEVDTGPIVVRCEEPI